MTTWLRRTERILFSALFKALSRYGLVRAAAKRGPRPGDLRRAAPAPQRSEPAHQEDEIEAVARQSKKFDSNRYHPTGTVSEFCPSGWDIGVSVVTASAAPFLPPTGVLGVYASGNLNEPRTFHGIKSAVMVVEVSRQDGDTDKGYWYAFEPTTFSGLYRHGPFGAGLPGHHRPLSGQK